jgi:6-phosphogluconolactonase (cycloisomerase 2 family)
MQNLSVRHWQDRQISPRARAFRWNSSITSAFAFLAIVLSAAAQSPGGGKYPRHFALDPSGNYLFVENQNSDNIVEFRVDRGSGALMPTGTDLKTSIPMCVVFVRAQ